jgi:predicted dehydrogenase/threonine dehydrogenase-like Zn-dependent dehydrogenase
MKQVVQPIAGGRVQVLEVPRPVAGPTEVLVRTVASVISAGTERSATELARSSLLAKARARPDLVRQAIRKARTDGLAVTTQTVRSRLAEDLPLGYSAAGEVVEVGSAVAGIRIGQLVATGGAGKANHAEFQAVPGLLCAVVPAGVPPCDAAFATITSIALHGLRMAHAGPGSKVVIVGLGLVGQLAARLAMAAGCDVAGIDPAAHARTISARSGVLALDECGQATTDEVLAWSRGRGADAVLLCAATKSSGPALRVPELCRDSAAVVVVGDVGLHLERTPFYEREISLCFARSYGPGRYDASYEAWGVDYPVGQVRWTEGRNLEAVLDLLAADRLRVSDLVTHTFDIESAAKAYELLERRKDPYLAISLTYRAATGPERPVPVKAAARPKSALGIGWIGAGAFSTSTLLPAFRAAGFDRFVCVASASGLTALRTAEQHGFEKAVSGAVNVIEDPGVDIVVVATPHGTHAEMVTLALKAGRHVWCEKPLALTAADLSEIEAAWIASGRQLMAGFNRRWSPAVRAGQRALAGMAGSKLIVYRVAAGPVREGHWYTDRRHGGRLLGEVCHFIDTAQALVGEEIENVGSVLADAGSRVPGNEALVSMRFADGSLAAVCYGSGMPRAGKEWIEVTSGSHRLVIDDFRSATLNGRTLWKGAQDKGHRAQTSAFWHALRGGPASPTGQMLATMRATIQAADAGLSQD